MDILEKLMQILLLAGFDLVGQNADSADIERSRFDKLTLREEVALRAATPHVDIKVIPVIGFAPFDMVVVDNPGLLLAGNDLYFDIGFLFNAAYVLSFILLSIIPNSKFQIPNSTFQIHPSAASPFSKCSVCKVCGSESACVFPDTSAAGSFGSATSSLSSRRISPAGGICPEYSI